MDDLPFSPLPAPDDPRVRFAAERTALAWMRTALAMLGFGFVVARFGLFLRELAMLGHAPAGYRASGWSIWIGTGMILLGVAVTLIASWEYARFLRLAARRIRTTPRTAALTLSVSLLLAALGILMAVYLLWIGDAAGTGGTLPVDG